MSHRLQAVALPVLVAVALFSMVDRAPAQLGVPSIAPARGYTPPPKFSPWLNMNRLDPGPLGPYLSYVRPEQQLRRTLEQEQEEIRRTRQRLDAMSRQQTNFESRGSITPTGVGGAFMNYSHYYVLPGGRR